MTSAGDRLFGPFDAVGAWRRLADASVNYSLDEVRRPAWNFDAHRIALPAEPPGPPTPTGSWTHARRMVRDYEFSPPEIVRALYDPTAPLLGRDMLLEARFNAIHFYCGVRVTEVVDETRDGTDHVWGWAYETLDGHLERGKVTYEVVKHGRTGAVEFLATSYSQGAPALGPVTSSAGGCSAAVPSFGSTGGAANAYGHRSRQHCAASPYHPARRGESATWCAPPPTRKHIAWTRWPSSASHPLKDGTRENETSCPLGRRRHGYLTDSA